MTKGLKAQLEISADASGVEAGVGKAKRSLASLGATAKSAGQDAAEGLAKVGEGGGAAATKIDRATQNIIGSIQRTTAALDAGGKSSSAYFSVLAQQRGIDPNALKPYLDQLDAVAQRSKAAAQAVTGTIAPLGQVGMSARATAAAMRQVPAQFTDIVTSIQAGQAPLTVLLQQGGQLKDVFGGVGPAARALGGYILGLINPFSIAAAAAGVLAFAFKGGREESTEYAKALILSGNAAGVTVGQMGSMARAISAVAGTQSNAAEAITQLAAAGLVAGSNLEKLGLAAVQFERATGTAISATVKQFAELGKAPVDASVKLNESMNYLTLSTYRQIKVLEDQGRTVDAATLAQKAYADALLSRSGEIETHLGTVQRAWIGIKDAAGSAWDAMLKVGRQKSTADLLAEGQAKLADLQARGELGSRGGRSQSTTNAEIAAQNGINAALSRRLVLEGDVAAATAAATAQVKARIDFDKAGEQFATNAAKMEREITKARNEGAAAGATQAEIEKRISDIRAKFSDKGAAKLALGIDKAQLQLDLDAIQKASDKLTGIFQNQERLLEAQRSAGGVSEAEYYERKRTLIIAQAEVQDYLLQQEIKRTKAESLNGKDAIDNARRLVDEESKLAKLREDTSGKLAVLATQEAAASSRLALSFLTARQAAQDYFDTVQRQQARDLAGQGQGAQSRNRDAGFSQIEDRYAGQRRDVDNLRAQLLLSQEGKITDTQQAQLTQRLALIDEFQSKSIASYADYYARRVELEGNAGLGAQEALQNYFDNAQKLGKQTEDAIGRTLGGIEDAFVTLATTGKLSFRDLANSIIAEIIRIQARAAIAGLLKMFTGVGASTGFGTGSSFGNQDLGGFLAEGGPAQAGKTYVVGEKGPELLRMGANPGMVVPNNALRSGGGDIHINQTVNVGSGVSRAEVAQAMQTSKAELKGELLKLSSRREGPFQ